MDGGMVKQTGVETPVGWRKAKVAQLASIITGPFGTLLKASEYGGADGVPLISVGEIREGFLRVTDETPTVAEVVTKRLPQYLLREGDIVFGRKGGVERSAIINQHQAGWFLGSDGISIRLKEGVHRPFFGHAFRSSTVQTWLLQNASGTTMPSLNQAILGAVEIPFPDDPKEQAAIAEALSDADALIEGLERLIAKKRLIKQGAMQDLLTARRRLPGFSGEWEQTKLRSLLKSAPSYGINSAACPLGSGGYDYLRITDIDEHGRLRQEGRAEVLHPAATRYFLEPDDIVVARTGASTGKSYRYYGPNSRTVFAGFLIKLTPTPDSVVPSFLFQIMQTDVYWSWIAENSARSGQPGINGQQLSGMSVVIPTTVAEQQAIASILDDMDAEIQALETRLAKARQVKEGMMQNLLTGRIRLI